MNRLHLRRSRAGLLLAMLLGGPVGPMGALHVAHLEPAAAFAGGAALDDARAVSPHDGRPCVACQLLTGLRWMPTGHGFLVPAEVAAAPPVLATLPVTTLWLGDSPSSRAPPLS